MTESKFRILSRSGGRRPYSEYRLTAKFHIAFFNFETKENKLTLKLTYLDLTRNRTIVYLCFKRQFHGWNAKNRQEFHKPTLRALSVFSTIPAAIFTKAPGYCTQTLSVPDFLTQRHHFPKQININLCEVLVLSVVRSSKNVTFCNV